MNIYDHIINDYKPDMGKRIRACRRQSNLTQEKMAEILDISVKHYSEVERGITGLSVEKLIFLSRLFDTSLDYLLKGDEEPSLIPCVLINLYRSCPDDKKAVLIEMAKNLSILMEKEKGD